MVDQSQQGATSEFFIPDLCATRPVMFLLILADLLVVVYVLIVFDCIVVRPSISPALLAWRGQFPTAPVS